jgi:hypothetical protein
LGRGKTLSPEDLYWYIVEERFNEEYGLKHLHSTYVNQKCFDTLVKHPDAQRETKSIMKIGGAYFVRVGFEQPLEQGYVFEVYQPKEERPDWPFQVPSKSKLVSTRVKDDS